MSNRRPRIPDWKLLFPTGGTADHLSVGDEHEPDQRTIPEDWSPDDATEGTNDYGSPGYGGPNPPDKEHTYEFTLSALDTTLDLEAEADALESATEGHVLVETQLTGMYPA